MILGFKVLLSVELVYLPRNAIELHFFKCHFKKVEIKVRGKKFIPPLFCGDLDWNILNEFVWVVQWMLLLLRRRMREYYKLKKIGKSFVKMGKIGTQGAILRMWNVRTVLFITLQVEDFFIIILNLSTWFLTAARCPKKDFYKSFLQKRWQKSSKKGSKKVYSWTCLAAVLKPV